MVVYMPKTLLFSIFLCTYTGRAQDSSFSSSNNASPTSSGGPTATLDSATVTGISTSGVHKFLGIPYASPPTSSLRYSTPVPITSYNENIDAVRFGYSCPQQNASLVSRYFHFPRRVEKDQLVNIDPAFMDVALDDDDDKPEENEDCLTVNVMRPENITESSKLPVVVWIYGGGFETGTTYSSDENAVRLVRRSTELGQPLVYVSMNYRVSGFGFMASQEIKNANATNLGLKDQRVALQWVNKYINNFGGDNDRVVIWGQSAGAISVSLQMLTNNGNTEGLFRGAFMQSGSPIPVGNYTNGQVYYNQVVNQTGCGDSDNTLGCLRNVSYDTLHTAINKTPNYFSYSSLDLVWTPRADGEFLSDDPQRLVENGTVANIPMVNGDVADEGTLFALSSLNVTDTDDFRSFLKYTYLTDVPSDDVDQVLNLYPSNRKAGSPFNTSFLNAITPEYKRSAAFQGDAVFQAPRRFFLQHRAAAQPVWSYLSTRGKSIPFVGSYHGSDISRHVLEDYLIRFTTNLNPNNGTGLDWPQYNNSAKQMYAFTNEDENTGVGITTDDYRVPQMEYLMNLSLQYPL